MDSLKINYEIEKNINSKFVDYFLTDYNIAIEYFGDYWHSNPKAYESDYYFPRMKMMAKEIWEKDRKRLIEIKQSVESIIIIWESSKINESILEKTIKNILNKKTIIYI